MLKGGDLQGTTKLPKSTHSHKGNEDPAFYPMKLNPTGPVV